MQLNELGELRQDSLQRTILIQNQRSKWQDKYIKKKHFQPRDWALLFDSKYKILKGKLATRWLGPYEVETVFDNGSIKIKTIDDSQQSFIVNGHKLKIYHKPLTKEQFLQVMSTATNVEVVGRVFSLLPAQVSFVLYNFKKNKN